eukprot:10188962-Karenia_brevis.AAC.1
MEASERFPSCARNWKRCASSCSLARTAILSKKVQLALKLLLMLLRTTPPAMRQHWPLLLSSTIRQSS